MPTFTDFIPTFPTVNRKFLITDFQLLSTSVKRENFIDFYRSQKKVKDPRSLLNILGLNGIMVSVILWNDILLNAILLNAIKLNVDMLNFIILNFTILNVTMLNAIMLSVILLNDCVMIVTSLIFTILTFIIQNVVILHVIMLSVIPLNVVAPKKGRTVDKLGPTQQRKSLVELEFSALSETVFANSTHMFANLKTT